MGERDLGKYERDIRALRAEAPHVSLLHCMDGISSHLCTGWTARWSARESHPGDARSLAAMQADYLSGPASSTSHLARQEAGTAPASPRATRMRG